MTLLVERTIFDEALLGRPLPAPVADPPRLIEDWWVRLPVAEPTKAPDTQLLTREIRRWTAWSTRTTAEALGTSHTTVLAMEDGRPLVSGRSGDLRRCLYDLHALVKRLYLLTDRDPVMTGNILHARDEHGESPLSYIRARLPSKAYIAALDVVKPRQRTGLVVGDRPAKPGTATAPLAD